MAKLAVPNGYEPHSNNECDFFAYSFGGFSDAEVNSFLFASATQLINRHVIFRAIYELRNLSATCFHQCPVHDQFEYAVLYSVSITIQAFRDFPPALIIGNIVANDKSCQFWSLFYLRS